MVGAWADICKVLVVPGFWLSTIFNYELLTRLIWVYMVFYLVQSSIRICQHIPHLSLSHL